MTVKAEELTYGGARSKLLRTRGPAAQQICLCGERAQEWAYDRKDENELVTPKGYAYSADTSHYEPRCKKCNRAAANVRATAARAPGYTVSASARFSSYVQRGEPHECWEWQGTVKRHGYGQMWFRGKSDRAHRVSYQLHNGAIPEGLLIRHTCDNKLCVNPGHLITGTGKDNARDAVERGLYPRGETQGRSKLTLEQVREIRRNWKNRTESQKSMAGRFGVSTSAVQFVAAGQSWRGLGVDE